MTKRKTNSQELILCHTMSGPGNMESFPDKGSPRGGFKVKSLSVPMRTLWHQPPKHPEGAFLRRWLSATCEHVCLLCNYTQGIYTLEHTHIHVHTRQHTHSNTTQARARTWSHPYHYSQAVMAWRNRRRTSTLPEGHLCRLLAGI